MSEWDKWDKVADFTEQYALDQRVAGQRVGVVRNLTVQTLLELRVVPLLERIAVALEKRATLPPPEEVTTSMPACLYCGASYFPDHTGHHPKCANPQRR